jgi:hypothetical protein
MNETLFHLKMYRSCKCGGIISRSTDIHKVEHTNYQQHTFRFKISNFVSKIEQKYFLSCFFKQLKRLFRSSKVHNDR